jgi:hypothetical protein
MMRIVFWPDFTRALSPRNKRINTLKKYENALD